jgi:hypothetical protein
MVHKGSFRDLLIPKRGQENAFWSKVSAIVNAVHPKPRKRVICVSSSDEDETSVDDADGANKENSESQSGSGICAGCDGLAQV